MTMTAEIVKSSDASKGRRKVAARAELALKNDFVDTAMPGDCSIGCSTDPNALAVDAVYRSPACGLRAIKRQR